MKHRAPEALARGSLVVSCKETPGFIFTFLAEHQQLYCYWVGSLDFEFLVEIKVFSTKAPKSCQLFAGGSLQQPSFIVSCRGPDAKGGEPPSSSVFEPFER